MIRRRMGALLLLAALGAGLSACWNRIGQPPKPSEQEIVEIALGQPFTLNAGQKAALNVNEAIVSFVNVSEDSRCPSDVACVWAGQVTVTMRVVVRGEALGDFPLTLTAGQPASAEFEGFTLTLSAVDPYPDSDEPIRPADYRATLTLDKP